MARVCEKKTLAFLGNCKSFSVAGLWRARKWVERNEARGIKQLPYKPHERLRLKAHELF